MKKNQNFSRFPRESSWRSHPPVESKSRDSLSLLFHSVKLLLGHEGRRGEIARVRTVIRESFHPLKSGTLLRLLHRFLLPSSYRYTRTTFIVKRARARTEDRTSCNHITDSSNGHPRREEKRREEEGARWMLDPVLKPERRLPRIEITANGSTWQRESRRSPAVRGGGRKKKKKE